MGFLSQYGLFVTKALTIVIALLICLAGILAISRKVRPKLELKSLNKEFEALKKRLCHEIKDEKPKKKKKEKKGQPTLYVLDFQGDIKATQVDALRESITAILAVVEKKDEVMLRLESPGGAVSGYGLAASQLQRLKDRNIPLTVCIDKIAASGGYLMACVADRIIAAPFAIIGSIGVVAQLPNFHRWLKKNNIDVELLTAGEYKRTLTLFGENTEKGREKFQEDLEKIHQAFRDYVMQNRQQLDIDQVSTGEHWLAKDAFDLKLVDNLQTSDDYLLEKMTEFNAFHLHIHCKKSFLERVLKPTMNLLNPLS